MQLQIPPARRIMLNHPAIHHALPPTHPPPFGPSPLYEGGFVWAGGSPHEPAGHSPLRGWWWGERRYARPPYSAFPILSTASPIFSSSTAE